MQTTIRVDTKTRDALASRAYLAGLSLGDFLTVLSHADIGVVLKMAKAWKTARETAGRDAASRASRGLK